MTANYFESTVKYMKVNEDGREKKVSELYLIDAMSFTETEQKSCKELNTIAQVGYDITAIKKSKITEVIESNDENDDRWYKAKIAIIDADEVSGQEKVSFQYYLVAASNINRALENLEKSLSTFVVPYEIASLSETKFIDVIQYKPEEMPDNLKPISDEE